MKFLILVLSFVLASCSTMTHVVTPKNKSQFPTSELCVYAYDYSHLPGWAYDADEWSVINEELVSRGYKSKDDCSSFNYGMAECSKRTFENKELMNICVNQYALSYENEVKKLFDSYALRKRNQEHAFDVLIQQNQNNINSLQRQQMQNRILRCNSNAIGSTINTTCY